MSFHAKEVMASLSSGFAKMEQGAGRVGESYDQLMKNYSTRIKDLEEKETQIIAQIRKHEETLVDHEKSIGELRQALQQVIADKAGYERRLAEVERKIQQVEGGKGYQGSALGMNIGQTFNWGKK